MLMKMKNFKSGCLCFILIGWIFFVISNNLLKNGISILYLLSFERFYELKDILLFWSDVYVLVSKRIVINLLIYN